MERWIKMYTVFFKKQRNSNKNYYQCESGTVGSKAFRTEAEAKEFAAIVGNAEIYSPTGKRIF